MKLAIDNGNIARTPPRSPHLRVIEGNPDRVTEIEAAVRDVALFLGGSADEAREIARQLVAMHCKR